MSSSKQSIISVKNVSKSFVLPHEKRLSLKSRVIHPLARGKSETQQALNNINFDVHKGEFFGIVGRNGSGKSTLLKLLAGIYRPTVGTIDVRGGLVPFIELGVGFNMELSGRDNVYLNGALLGFSRSEIDGMYDGIFEFAELERFQDQKLKNYSSGMQVRLAFSIAIRAHADILLIDEVLAVGDANFQRKCYEYFKEIKNSDTTVLFVSHDSASVQRFCDRAILIEKGDLVYEGKPEDVVNSYINLNVDLREKKESASLQKKVRKVTTEFAELSSLQVLDEAGKERSTFKPYEKIVIKVSGTARSPLQDPVVRVAAKGDGDALALFTLSTSKENIRLGKIKKGQSFSVSFVLENRYHDTNLVLGSTLFDAKEREMYASLPKAAKFSTFGWSTELVGSTYPLSSVDFVVE